MELKPSIRSYTPVVPTGVRRAKCATNANDYARRQHARFETSEAKAPYILREARDKRGGGVFPRFLLVSCFAQKLRSPCLDHEAAVMQVNTHVTEGCSNCNLYKAQKFKCPHVFFFFLRNPTKGVQKCSNNFSGAVFTWSNVLALACRWTSNIRSYARSIAVWETESISIF